MSRRIFQRHDNRLHAPCHVQDKSIQQLLVGKGAHVHHCRLHHARLLLCWISLLWSRYRHGPSNYSSGKLACLAGNRLYYVGIVLPHSPFVELPRPHHSAHRHVHACGISRNPTRAGSARAKPIAPRPHSRFNPSGCLCKYAVLSMQQSWPHAQHTLDAHQRGLDFRPVHACQLPLRRVLFSNNRRDQSSRVRHLFSGSPITGVPHQFLGKHPYHLRHAFPGCSLLCVAA